MNGSGYKVSVIMPALDEEPNLAAAVEDVLEGFKRFHIAGELIIVNDGSKDRTGEMADEFSSRLPFVRVIHNSRPSGIGASFLKGIQEAEGETVVIIPGDGENDAAGILQCLPLMEHVDIVIPYICNPEIRSLWRRTLSFLFREIINISFGLSIRCVTGTVLYRRAVLEGVSIVSRGFFYQPELLVKTIKRGYIFVETPCCLKGRLGGSSKSTSLKSLFDVIRSYLLTAADVYTGNKKGTAISSRSVTSARMKEHV